MKSNFKLGTAKWGVDTWPFAVWGMDSCGLFEVVVVRGYKYILAESGPKQSRSEILQSNRLEVPLTPHHIQVQHS